MVCVLRMRKKKTLPQLSPPIKSVYTWKKNIFHEKLLPFINFNSAFGKKCICKVLECSSSMTARVFTYKRNVIAEGPGLSHLPELRDLAGWTLSSGDGWKDGSRAGCGLSFPSKKTNCSNSLNFSSFVTHDFVPVSATLTLNTLN